MSTFVVLLLVAVTLSVVCLGAAVWRAALALRRLHRSTRRLVDRGVLSVKAHALPPGRARQVAGLRLDLRAGMDHTRRVLEDATCRNCPLGELPELFRRVEHLAESVDGELRMLEGEPDVVQRERLATVRQRSEDLVATAANIRRAVSGVQTDLYADLFPPLRGDVDVEVSALRAGVAAARWPGTLPSRLVEFGLHDVSDRVGSGTAAEVGLSPSRRAGE
jgi:hypothetical protein